MFEIQVLEGSRDVFLMQQLRSTGPTCSNQVQFIARPCSLKFQQYPAAALLKHRCSVQFIRYRPGAGR